MISVNYATAAGGAQPGSDFENESGTLSWNDGDASDKELDLNLINDTVAEADEDFTLTLSAPAGGAQLAASEATRTIPSEDGPGQVRFSLDVHECQRRSIFFDEGAFGYSVDVRADWRFERCSECGLRHGERHC